MYISIVGGVVVVTGLYLVVWGKSKEQKNVMMSESPQKISQQLPITVPQIDDNENNNKPQLVIIGDQTSNVEVKGSST